MKLKFLILETSKSSFYNWNLEKNQVTFKKSKMNSSIVLALINGDIV
jgi:hypothetical protein